MILEALYRYYQVLLKDPEVEIALPGYSQANVSFALNISPKGELLDIIPYTTNVFDGKKTKELPYKRMFVPEQEKKASGIKPNFLCDNSAYILGISSKEDKSFAKQRFEAFRQYNIKLLSKLNSKNANAVISFLNYHEPEKAAQHPAISKHLEEILKGGNITFQINGNNILEDPEIKTVWEEFREGESAIKMQCLVTGEIEPIARLHPSIKKVRDAQPTGASLVSFNERAYESYNRIKEQGLNSPVSKQVASGYGVALNYLLSDQNPNRKIYIGDTTVVYWAESENKEYPSLFSMLLNPDYIDNESTDNQAGRQIAEKLLGELAVKIQKGQKFDAASSLAGLRMDHQVRFFVLGLAANSARLAVRFYLTEPFGKFIERVVTHYDDMHIQKEYSNQSDYISIYKILIECVSPKVTRREDEIKTTFSLLGGALMRSVLTGSPYPEGLYAAVINRIRHDSDEKGRSIKINYVRAAYIKAHLLRKYRHQAQNPIQEALQMSLNESFPHPAYILGRLFAVLEKAQQEAIGEVNAGIKDRYFTSACASPASVFPILLRLSHHHTAKAEYGYATDYRIQQLLNLLEAKPFPVHLSLDEQGVFILGYYHQRAAFYVKNSGSLTESVKADNQPK